jgi:hypothetical protein
MKEIYFPNRLGDISYLWYWRIYTDICGANFFLVYVILLKSLRVCIEKFADWVDKEINEDNNKRSLRSNTKGYGGKTH